MGGGTSTTTTQKLGPEQRQLFDLILPTLKKFSDPNAVDPWTGSKIVDFNQNQKRGQEMMLRYAKDMQSWFKPLRKQNAKGVKGVGFGTDSLSGLAKGQVAGAQAGRDFITSPDILSPDSNSYLKATAEAVQDSLAKQVTDNILPSIRGGAQTSGQTGGSRQAIIESRALADLMKKQADATTGLYSQGYGQGLNALVSGVGQATSAQGQAASELLGQGTKNLSLAPAISDLGLSPSKIFSAVGGQKQIMSQSLLNDEIDQYMSNQMFPFMMAKDMANLIFGMPTGTTTATQKTDPNPLAILQLIMAMAS